MPNFQALKISRRALNDITRKIKTFEVWLYFIRRTTRPGYAGTTTNLQIVLNNPKKYLPNFPTQKNPGIKNFKPKKNPLIIPVT